MTTATRVRFDGMFWHWIKAQADKEGMEPRAWMKKALGYPLLEGDDEVYDFVMGKINGRALVNSGLKQEFIRKQLLQYVVSILKMNGVDAELDRDDLLWIIKRNQRGLPEDLCSVSTNSAMLMEILERYPDMHPIVVALFHWHQSGVLVKNIVSPDAVLKRLGKTARKIAEMFLAGGDVTDVIDSLNHRAKVAIAAKLMRKLGFNGASVGDGISVVLWARPGQAGIYKADPSYTYCAVYHSSDDIFKLWPKLAKFVPVAE